MKPKRRRWVALFRHSTDPSRDAAIVVFEYDASSARKRLDAIAEARGGRIVLLHEVYNVAA